jgi:putative PEP-CTERM system TPR-repeat lipoprotein
MKKCIRDNAMVEAKFSTVTSLLRIAVAGCLLAIVACGDSDSSAEYMSQAEEQFAQNNYNEAIVELKNALDAANEQQEALPRARWMLGKSYLETGNVMAAAKELRRANELGWNPNEVLPALAKALLSKGELEQVMALSSAGLEPKAAAQLQAQQALAQMGQGDIWTADTYIAKAAELHADDVEVQIAEARMLGASGDIDGALAVIQRVLNAQPDKRDAWSLKGDFLSAQNKLPEALAAFEVAIELSPENMDDRFKRGLLNLHLQRPEEVVPDIEFLLEAAPKHPLSNYLQGSLDFHSGNYADSITALTLAEPAAEQYPLILFYLAGAHLVEGSEAQALKYAEQQVSINPNFAPGRVLLASIYVQNSNAEAAQRTLRPVLDADPTDGPALKLMAKALMLGGETDQALKILRTLQQMAPDSAVAHFELGAGLLFDGQGEAANQQFEAALALDPTMEQAAILRMHQLSDTEGIDGAIAAAQEYAHSNPDSVQAHTLLGQKYLANKQVDEAIAAFNKALSLAPGDPAANHALAQIELDRGNTAASRARYQAVLAERPDYLPTLLQLAILAAEPGNEIEMVSQLEHAIEAHPDALEPKLMLARFYVYSNAPGNIPALFASLSELQQKSPDVLYLLALAQIAERQYDKALRTLEQLVQLEPDTAEVHHLLATAAEGIGDTERARVALKRAEEVDENFAPALVSLAKLAWADGNVQLFDTYLQRLIKLSPHTPDVLRLQAVAAQRDGDPARAVELSRQVLAAEPGTMSMLELAGYLYVSGSSKEALQVVQDWVAQNPTDVDARMALVSQLAGLGQTEAVIQQLRELVKLQPRNAEVLNNLAWYLREQAPLEALEFSRLAVSLSPDRAELLDTLALLESDAGNQQQALEHIKRAVAVSPGSSYLLYHHAMIEARLGNKATAIDILKTALEGGGTAFPEREKAEQLLASLQQ